MLASPAYDIALILNQGQRDTQEDAVAARTFDAVDAGYIVIADGMVGHEAGEVASELVISAWRDALDDELDVETLSERGVVDALPMAAMQANASIANHSEEKGPGFNMGSTLLGALLLDNRVYWISIGDSPFYLFRDGVLSQMNEDHSMAPSIDAQVALGNLTEEQALAHPDRNQLTSVVMGGAIPKVDCPEEPLNLTGADIVILGSDGLQTLSDSEIQNVLTANQHALAQEIADALLKAVLAKANPDQDNLTIAVAKPNKS